MLKTEPITRFIPVEKWPDIHPWPSISGLRALMHKRHENGFDVCIKRVGRRTLIDEAAFIGWVNAKAEEATRS